MAETPFESTTNFTGSGPRSDRKLQSIRTPWLSRRYTPYPKTPKSARISNFPAHNDENRSKTPTTSSRDDRNHNGPSPVSTTASDVLTPSDQVRNLVGKTWSVYSASPLYNFKYSATSVKSYAKSLSAYLEAETEGGDIAVDLDRDKNSSGKFKVELNFIKELTLVESDSPAVEITIVPTRKEPTKKSRNSSASPILTALFCSLGNEAFEDAKPKIRENFTSLPICLIRGPAALARCFISGLEAQFDCKISPLSFSSMDLGWFVSLWAGVIVQERSRPVELCYRVPTTIKGLSRIIYSIKAKDVKAIWDCVHEKNSPVFTEAESGTFIKALESHFYHHFKVDLSRMPLSRVGTSIVLVGSEGRLKFFHPSYVKHILQQITQTALISDAYGRL